MIGSDIVVYKMMVDRIQVLGIVRFDLWRVQSLLTVPSFGLSH